ncbi:MAG: excinuclease ABC subunit UvrB [bacterium]
MFKLISPHEPCGDQPEAIKQITEKLRNDQKDIVLLGVTGSGKTFTVANVIAELNRPTLIIAPNKTLAAQLYEEMKLLFPENAVSYFVSYYDYYQPEAYIPATDTYIEKDSAINDEIDKLRHAATSSLLTRRDVIIVASVSCIYGLGSPEEYLKMSVIISKDEKIKRNDLLRKITDIHYKRNDMDFERGSFRVRGDVIELLPAYSEDIAYRIEFFGDEVDRLSIFDPITAKVISREEKLFIYPASHYATSKEIAKKAIKSIQAELAETLPKLKSQMKLLEAKRLEERTYYDIEMMEELGYCKGIENYSRHLTSREPGSPPPTLLEYFPKDFLVVIDESHITVPQISGMYKGDRSRKLTLIEYGFRMPSALDNRPLNFEEFEKNVNQTVYVSATPGSYELDKVDNKTVEQIIRPTGLVDPVIEVHPCKNQVDHLLGEIQKTIKNNERVLVTTLTKKMAEDLSAHYLKKGLKVNYLHSDVSTLERIEIINDLRRKKYDVLVGINLLREGLDLPEVSLVAILDADKEGFLRSTRSLIQIIGRAARNVNGRVIMYADKMTDSLNQAIKETDRRRIRQLKYNKDNNITPKTIVKNIHSSLSALTNMDYADDLIDQTKKLKHFKTTDEIDAEILRLNQSMIDHARKLEFEKAAKVRDDISKLKMLRLELG